MLKPRCSECGETKPLNEDGVCRNRGGCEHRQFQHKARVERLQKEMDHAECCPIHGTDPKPYDLMVQNFIMGVPLPGSWYRSMDQKIFGSDEDEGEQ